MAGVVQFIKESYEEMTDKVTWPTWGQLQNSAVLVLVASLIIAVVIFAMDKGATYILDTFYKSISDLTDCWIRSFWINAVFFYRLNNLLF